MTTTDCRSEEGITVGLIDAMIAIARVLSTRRFSPSAVKEALADFRSDSDVLIVLGQSQMASSPDEINEVRPR